MEAFGRVVALSPDMLLETFKAFASSLLHRKLCVEWSDYTLSHRYWGQVVTDIGTGKSPVLKTVREAFARALVPWQHPQGADKEEDCAGVSVAEVKVDTMLRPMATWRSGWLVLLSANMMW